MIRPIAAFALLIDATLACAQHPPVDPPEPNDPAGVNKSLLRFNEDDAPVRTAADNRDEALAYDYLVGFARNVNSGGMARLARRDLTFAQLLGPEAPLYRGDVVHVAGRLKRVRDIGPTPGLRADGVERLFEGWIFSDLYRGYSYCAVFTELPAGLAVAESLDRRVAFDGFFFKVYRFRAGDGPRRAPLLIGRALTPLPDPPAPAASDDLTRALPVAMTLLFVGLLLGGGVVVWMRYSDTVTRRRLDAARAAAKPPDVC